MALSVMVMVVMLVVVLVAVLCEIVRSRVGGDRLARDCRTIGARDDRFRRPGTMQLFDSLLGRGRVAKKREHMLQERDLATESIIGYQSVGCASQYYLAPSLGHSSHP